jgi:hypothetical protein
MSMVQTILFEGMEVDISTRKSMFIHPIHRILASEFPAFASLSALTSVFDLIPGSYQCRHHLLSDDRKQVLVTMQHEPVSIEAPGGGVGFQSTFENVKITAPGRLWVRTEVVPLGRAADASLKPFDVVLRVEGARSGAPRLKLQA